jgi:hypothetical protein
LEAVRLPLRQAERARVCRSIVSSRRQKRRGDDGQEGMGRGLSGSRQSVDVEDATAMLLWGIFGHWQNIRRIRKAKRRLAAGRAWWGQQKYGPCTAGARTLDKNDANCLAAASMETFFSSSTHSRAHFIVGELELCLAQAGRLLQSGSSLSCAPDQYLTPFMEVCESQFGSMCNASYRRSLHPNHSRDPDQHK